MNPVSSITHLQSSTQIINLDGIKILTDPWLTDGEYYGSWYHYPPFPESKLAELEYDYIYVSHIHPDHLSEKTFAKLPRKVPVLIHRFFYTFLKRKIESFGFEVIELNHGEPFSLSDNASVEIFSADSCNPALCGKQMGCAPIETEYLSTNIDTLALFSSGALKILNTNDCPLSLAEKTIRNHGLNNDIDCLLVGYAGAGPYPQCFEFDDIAEISIAAETKKKQFLDQAVKYCELVQPRFFVPFAGTYILGGHLTDLTELRGVPSVPEALDYIAARTDSTGIHLQAADELLLASGQLNLSKLADFPLSYEQYKESIRGKRLDYENDIATPLEDVLPLLEPAYQRFSEKALEIGFQSEFRIVIVSEKLRFCFTTDTQPEMLTDDLAVIQQPFLQIALDYRLLVRLLKGPRYAHWNNAEIGSHLRYHRKPDVFERALYHCLCYFHA